MTPLHSKTLQARVKHSDAPPDGQASTTDSPRYRAPELVRNGASGGGGFGGLMAGGFGTAGGDGGTASDASYVNGAGLGPGLGPGLGGGFALADMTEKSGLSQFLVDQLDGLKVWQQKQAL